MGFEGQATVSRHSFSGLKDAITLNASNFIRCTMTNYRTASTRGNKTTQPAKSIHVVKISELICLKRVERHKSIVQCSLIFSDNKKGNCQLENKFILSPLMSDNLDQRQVTSQNTNHTPKFKTLYIFTQSFLAAKPAHNCHFSQKIMPLCF